MNRNEKIKLLQGIKERKISIESLLPPEIYIFMEKFDKPGTYEMNGKEYNEKEYLHFCKTVKKQDKIITFINAEGCEPLKECQRILHHCKCSILTFLLRLRCAIKAFIFSSFILLGLSASHNFNDVFIASISEIIVISYLSA
jgi:hypothetical protein